MSLTQINIGLKEFLNKYKKFNKLALSEALYQFYEQPPVMLGLIPLYSAKVVEYATSQDVLKMRAFGEQFLAHQDGDSTAYSIEGIFTGESETWKISLINLMYILGEGANEILTPNIVKSNPISEMTAQEEGGKRYGRSNFKWKEHRHHRTFTVIDKDSIHLNMYIETINYSWSVVDGKDTCRYNIVIRKYEGRPKLKVFKRVTTDIDVESFGTISKTDARIIPGTKKNLRYAKDVTNTMGQYVVVKPTYTDKDVEFEIAVSFMHGLLSRTIDYINGNRYRRMRNRTLGKGVGYLSRW